MTFFRDFIDFLNYQSTVITILSASKLHSTQTREVNDRELDY